MALGPRWACRGHTHAIRALGHYHASESPNGRVWPRVRLGLGGIVAIDAAGQQRLRRGHRDQAAAPTCAHRPRSRRGRLRGPRLHTPAAPRPAASAQGDPALNRRCINCRTLRQICPEALRTAKPRRIALRLGVATSAGRAWRRSAAFVNALPSGQIGYPGGDHITDAATS